MTRTACTKLMRLPPEKCASPRRLTDALGVDPVEVRLAKKMVAVLESGRQVAGLVPDLDWIKSRGIEGLIVTAPADPTRDEPLDFVSRYFAPHIGIPEDLVTGSAHCLLAPYWSERLGKTHMEARQLSKRGGHLALNSTVIGSR